MAYRSRRLRWFFESEEELSLYSDAGVGVIAKVEVVEPPVWACSRGPMVCPEYFEARIVGPDSYLTGLSERSLPVPKIHKIDFACPGDYEIALHIYGDWYNVSQIEYKMKLGIYYTALISVGGGLVALYVVDSHRGESE